MKHRERRRDKGLSPMVKMASGSTDELSMIFSFGTMYIMPSSNH